MIVNDPSSAITIFMWQVLEVDTFSPCDQQASQAL